MSLLPPETNTGATELNKTVYFETEWPTQTSAPLALMSTQLCNPVKTQILMSSNNSNSGQISAHSVLIIYGIASKKDESGELGNFKLADVE